MSLAMIAKLLGVDIPEELIAQLPDLAAQIPEIVNTAVQTIANVERNSAAVANVESSLQRIEMKLDVLGKAVLQLVEQQNNGNATIADTGTDATDSGSNNSNAAANVLTLAVTN